MEFLKEVKKKKRVLQCICMKKESIRVTWIGVLN